MEIRFISPMLCTAIQWSFPSGLFLVRRFAFSPLSLLCQRELRMIPTISAIEASPYASRNTVWELVRSLAIFVRFMEIDAPLQFLPGWAEVPDGAI